MLDKVVHVQVYYATKSVVNAKDLLIAFHTKNEYISKAKISSVCKPAIEHIGTWGEDFIPKNFPTAVEHHSKVENHTTHFISWESVKVAGH